MTSAKYRTIGLTVLVVVCMIWLAWVLVLRPYPMPSDSPEFWQKAVAGGIVYCGIDGEDVVAKFWVDDSPRHIQLALLNSSEYGKHFRRMRDFHEVARSDTELEASGLFSILGPVGMSFYFHARTADVDTADLRVVWTGTGSGLDVNDGSWRLQSFQNGTAVTYQIHLEPAGKLIPQRIWNRVMAVLIPKYLPSFQKAHS